jgi:hypothetical protein
MCVLNMQLIERMVRLLLEKRRRDSAEMARERAQKEAALTLLSDETERLAMGYSPSMCVLPSSDCSARLPIQQPPRHGFVLAYGHMFGASWHFIPNGGCGISKAASRDSVRSAVARAFAAQVERCARYFVPSLAKTDAESRPLDISALCQWRPSEAANWEAAFVAPRVLDFASGTATEKTLTLNFESRVLSTQWHGAP